MGGIIGITVLDRELNIIYANRAVRQWHSLSTSLIERCKCYQVLHRRSTQCPDCPVLRALATGESQMLEIPFLGNPAAGTLEQYAFPMKNAAGEVEMVLEYLRDITARKQAEELLKEREQLFRSLFENNSSMILLIDPDSAAIFDANPAACKFYGYTRKQLQAMKISEINTLSPEMLAAEMGKARIDGGNYFNFTHRRADGSLCAVEVYSGQITIGGQALLCSTIHDITARKEAEAEKDRLINQLRLALSEIKTLRGLLPVCSACKRIRDEQGRWEHIDVYALKHTNAEITHGICPECAQKLYPGLFDKP